MTSHEDIHKAIAKEIALGREACQPDRVTAAKIVELFSAREKRGG